MPAAQGGKLRVRIQQLLGAVDLLRRQTLGKVRAQAQPLGKKAPLGRAPRAAVPQLAGALPRSLSRLAITSVMAHTLLFNIPPQAC